MKSHVMTTMIVDLNDHVYKQQASIVDDEHFMNVVIQKKEMSCVQNVEIES